YCQLTRALLSLSYFFFFAMRRTPRSTLFPYTTLFRSPYELVRSLTGLEAAYDAVVVDCLTLWVSNRLLRGDTDDTILDEAEALADRKSTRLNSSHDQISYAVFCLKKKKQKRTRMYPHR